MNEKHSNKFAKSIILALSVLASLVFAACEPTTLPKPGFYSQSDREIHKYPLTVEASQGAKRQVTFNWTRVSGAVYYNIYRADTIDGTFEKIDETADDATTFTLPVKSGEDAYYKIAAVKYNGDVSDASPIVHATTLAQPVITDIEGVDGSSDSDVKVFWYMGNDDYYKDDVQYTVYCYKDGGTQPIMIKSVSGSKEVLFEGLEPNSKYFFQVEAFNLQNQDDTEISEKMDAETTKRTRPNAVEDLRVSQGESATENVITFKLPVRVEIDHSTNSTPDYYEHDLYFKIFRQELGGEAKEICSYFGKDKNGYKQNLNGATMQNINTTNFSSNETSGVYEEGATVEYHDKQSESNDLKRGVKYNYIVRSYVDTLGTGQTLPAGNNTQDKKVNDTNADKSVAENVGWLVSVPQFFTKNLTVDTNEDETKVTAISVNFELDFDTLGLDEKYNYLLQEKKAKKEFPSQLSTNSNMVIFKKLSDVGMYIRQWNESELDGFYYSYELFIVNAGVEDTNNNICKVSAHGRILADTAIGEKPVLEMFSLTSGYADKFIIKWKFNADYKYSLYYKDGDVNDSSSFTEITQENNSDFSKAISIATDGGTVTFEHKDAPSGTSRTYYLVVANGLYQVDSPSLTGKTLSKPIIFQSEYDYDSISVKWKNTEDADKYKFSMPNVSDVIEIEKDKFGEKDVDNNFSYKFDKEKIPSSYTSATESGKEILLQAVAVGHATETKYEQSKQEGKENGINSDGVQSTTTQLNEETTAETEIKVRTLGPALAELNASVANSPNSITVSWKAIEGAKAYAVVRNGWDKPAPKKDDTPDNAIYIYDVVKNTITSGGESVNNTSAKIVYNADSSVFTLTDIHTPAKAENNTGWSTSQARIKWGVPYDYIVLPLKSSTDDVVYTKDSAETRKKVSLGASSVELSDLDKMQKRGSALGYGWNVEATKGVQKEFSNTGTVLSVGGRNTSVSVTWENPYLPENSTSPRYSVYRKKEGEVTWTTLTTSTSSRYYSDTSAEPGAVYEYIVGVNANNIANDPKNDAAYIKYSDDKKDTKWNEKLAAGFIMPMAEVTKVSRDKRYFEKSLLGPNLSQAIPALDVEWGSVSVGGTLNRMIDGYILEVYNANLSNEWRTITTYKFGQTQLSPTNKSSQIKEMKRESPNFVSGVGSDNADTEIKTDHKLWFRIRPITDADDNISYGKEYREPYPDSNDTHDWSPSDGENIYTRWGTRLLTDKEFIYAATASIDNIIFAGSNQTVGQWASHSAGWYTKAYGNGKVTATSSWDVKWWSFYMDYCNSNFMKIDGRIGTLNPSSGRWPESYFTTMGDSSKPAWMSNNEIASKNKITWGTYNRMEGISPNTPNERYKGTVNGQERYRIKVLTSDSLRSELKNSGGDETLFDGWIGFANLNKNSSGQVFIWYGNVPNYNNTSRYYSSNGSQNVLTWTAFRHD